MKLLGSLNNGSIPYKKLVLELLVVFLGVTAGFVMNNYRSAQKEAELEVHYLRGFLSDVRANKEEYQEYVAQDSLWEAQITPNIKLMQADSFPLDSASKLLGMVTEIGKANVQNATYQDMVNSGNLNLIRNLELRRALTSYQLLLKDGAFLDEYFYSFFKAYVTPTVINDFDILKNKFVHKNVMRQHRFTNMILGYFSMVQQRNTVYNDLLRESKALETQIENELSRLE